MKKVISLALVLVLLTAALCGCESEEERKEALMGTWTMEVQATEKETMIRLENIDLYEEEILLVKDIPLTYVEEAEFEYSRYRIGFAVEETKACTREFYRAMVDTLYKNRVMLNGIYQQEFDQMSEAEFKQYYANMYNQETYEDMINYFADIAFQYDNVFDSGSYSIKGKRLQIVRDDVNEESGDLDYKIEGNTLTLSYSDSVNVYTRSN